MQDGLIDFGVGVLIGGLILSLCWGFFWLVIGAIGITRGTCSWRVLLNSMTVGGMPLLLIGGLMWIRGTEQEAGAGFVAGLAVIPLVMVGLGLRQAPDGARAGTHMISGVRHLMGELLGAHHDCAGCAHEHGPHDGGGCE